MQKIGDEYFTWFVDCEAPKACTILLRGASKDVLNEVERNLGDAMNVIRTIYLDPRLVPGGGATEMTLANKLVEQSKVQEPEIANAYRAAGKVRAPNRSHRRRGGPPRLNPGTAPFAHRALDRPRGRRSR